MKFRGKWKEKEAVWGRKYFFLVGERCTTLGVTKWKK
jgi:hypothetical protein